MPMSKMREEKQEGFIPLSDDSKFDDDQIDVKKKNSCSLLQCSASGTGRSSTASLN